MMNSLFVTGTDTNVGKTCVGVGLAASFCKMGVDVGIMKPFAAGTARKTGFKSDDAKLLADAAGIQDEETLINPQFFPISASPYTAWRKLQIKPNVDSVLSSFKRLQKMHQMVIVEGIGGLMTPILDSYFVADLIIDMGIPAVIVTGSKIGTINHTVLTCNMCKVRGIPLKGLIINGFEGEYNLDDLARDLWDLTSVPILGSIPPIKNLDVLSLSNIFQQNVDLAKLSSI